MEEADSVMTVIDGLLHSSRQGASPRGSRDVRSYSAFEALRRHAGRQAEECRAAGNEWRETGLVFANAVGGSLTTTNVTYRSFRPLLERAGLPLIRFHDLRHTAATLLLGKGIHPKVVSELLGHSQVGVTLDLYSHVTPTMHREAVGIFDDLLQR